MRGLGARVISFPTIAYAAPSGRADLSSDRIRGHDVVLFVSPRAVEVFARVADGPGLAALGDRPVGAVGAATERALANVGVTARIVAVARCGETKPRFGTEGLLAHRKLGTSEITGRSVLIVRGEGGRERLASELTGRGALVEYVEVYRRTRPEPDLAVCAEIIRGGDDTAVLIMSVEAFGNFSAMLGSTHRDWVESRQYVTVSGRIAQALRTGGVSRPVLVAAQASDDAIFSALSDWWGRSR